MGTYGFTAPEPGAVPGAASGGNDPERVGYARDLINDLFTDAARTDLPPLPVPDDFSRYQSIVPGIMLRSGARNSTSMIPCFRLSVHSPAATS